MTGPEFDEDGTDQIRPVPHPDDRLWRHPSEVAAMHAARAAHANAETAKIPAIQIDESTGRSRTHLGIVIAAGVVVVGAAALSIGVLSGQSSPRTTAVTVAGAPASAADSTNGQQRSIGDGTTSVALEAGTDGESALKTRIYAQTATSLPRIQAVTPGGMREGSGFFVTDAGHIATSAGLIENAEYVLAWTEDDQRWKAHVIASDAHSDVAVIRIDSDSWPAASFSGGAELWSGQYALALDYDAGEISLGEVTSVTGPTIGIDQPAAMPGSAIIDDTGSVIAMVTSDGTNRSATPAWMLEQVTIDLIASGTTTHIWLGVEVSADATDDAMLEVRTVAVASPAHDAGLRPGDLIDSVNGTATPDVASLHRVLQAAAPGDEARLTVTRNGSRRIITATLREVPGG